MADDFFFRELKDYATKEYKFRQRHSLEGIRAAGGDLSNGVCAAMCLVWIAEKMSHRAFSIVRSRGSFTDGGHEDRHNEAIMMKAYDLTMQHYSGRGGDLSDVEAALKLNNVSQDSVGIAPHRDEQLPQTMSRTIAQMPAGCAVGFEFDFVGPSANGRPVHMVCAYKSRSGTIHFFDPNAGIYKIELVKLAMFSSAWERACANRGWGRLAIRQRQFGHMMETGGIRFYRR